MEVSDMLDVLHYLIEDDMAGHGREQHDAKVKFRDKFYREFYGRNYRIDPDDESSDQETHTREVAPAAAAPGGRGYSYGGMAPDLAPQRGGPQRGRLTPGGNHMPAASKTLVHKPYIPPTDMNMSDDPFKPFRGLDVPLM